MQHGTLYANKVGHCNCPPCRAAGTRYNARRELLINTGRWEYRTDAEPVREHVNQLRAAGLGNLRIAALADIPGPTVQRLIYGRPSTGEAPTKRLQPNTAAALLAVRADLDTLAGNALTDATGTRRRSQALVCLGWSQGEQARQLDIEHGNYTRINRTPRVTANRARAVRTLYGELSMAPAPASQSATCAYAIAKRLRYAPPLAWDDDTIDDPNATPDLGAKVLASVALLENFEELTELGYTSDQAAERLEVTRDYLIELRRRARVRELAAA